MASPDAEIKGGGLSLPVWMKNKPTRDYEPFPASPPGQEDSFFYIRIPTSEALYSKPQSETLGLPGINQQHLTTTPIKPFYDAMNRAQNNSVNIIKTQESGSDDNSKGDSLKLSSRMISVSGRSVSSRGFTVATPAGDGDGPPPPPAPAPRRRGSKSLPASPLHTPPTSPNSRRKLNGNRYFTSPFEAQQDAVSGRSWLTMALLGFKKDLTTSSSTLAEEDDGLDMRLQGSLVESVESLGPAPRGIEPGHRECPTQDPKLTKPATMFRPKPSELREMNFWSPTSM